MPPDAPSPGRTPVSARTPLAATFALLGFAANSLLCRAALRGGAIDAWSFTFVRLASGALVLGLLARVARRAEGPRPSGSWGSAFALVLYAGAFSAAYSQLSTGVGALVLFSAVQATMLGWGLAHGHHPRAAEWLGLALALGGLVALTLPGASAPDLLPALLMALAGVGWGAYSLRGRASRAALADTAGNFARGVGLVLLALVPAWSTLAANPRGILLACASGALASGLGYSLWYAALPGLGATRAALVQLAVPVLTAGLGVLLLGETVTRRLALAGALILGGIALAVLLPARRTR